MGLEKKVPRCERDRLKARLEIEAKLRHKEVALKLKEVTKKERER